MYLHFKLLPFRRKRKYVEWGYCTSLHFTSLHCTALHCTVLYYIALYSTALYCTILHCTLLHCTVLYCTVLYCTVLYYIALYSTALYCTILHCTVLQCTTFVPAPSHRMMRFLPYRSRPSAPYICANGNNNTAILRNCRMTVTVSSILKIR
jgi:hypothetical protein